MFSAVSTGVTSLVVATSAVVPSPASRAAYGLTYDQAFFFFFFFQGRTRRDKRDNRERA